MKDFICSKECFISFSVALIPSVLLWVFKPTDSVPYFLFAILFLIALLFLWLFLMAYFSKNIANNLELINLISIYNGILVCRPNKLLHQNVFVSLFLNTNNFEKLIGYGYVSHIQRDGIIQITVSDFCDGFSLDKLKSQSTQNIIIRPTVTITYINEKLEKEYLAHETNTSSICNQ